MEYAWKHVYQLLRLAEFSFHPFFIGTEINVLSLLLFGTNLFQKIVFISELSMINKWFCLPETMLVIVFCIGLLIP